MNKVAEGDVEILLVEDNAGDIRLTKEAFSEMNVRTRVHIAQDGAAALQFLRKEQLYNESPHPDLIILDLNLPKKSGFEVLVQIKENPELRSIPVIILTSSNAEGDVRKSYENHANAYILKPVDLEEYFTIVKRINEFWLSTVRLLAHSPN